MKNILFIISFVLLSNVSFGQQQVNKKAKKAYSNFSYIKTTNQLLELAKEGKASTLDLQHLANSYYFNGDMMNASAWYSELINKGEEINPENYFRYALSLKAKNNYAEADVIMDTFCSLSPSDSRCNLFKKTSNYISEIEKISKNFQLQNLDINTQFSDFGTSTYHGNLIFASSKDINEELYSWNEQPFLDLFQLNQDGDVDEINGDINTKYHESSTTYTKDGKTMYFTRNNFFEGKLKNDSNNINKLKIYKATLVDGEWTNLESMPFNNDEYNVAHPALNEDETALYFSSDMPGTIGASDIFMVKIIDDGSYSEPVNLGSKINTEAKENFPFISDNGTLYFSSEGRVGLGGLDVFKFDNIEALLSSNKEAINLGKPFNSAKDDFGFIINETTRKGYISSNRPGGKGDDDIYSFEIPQCKLLVEGTVVDANTKEIIANADVTLYDKADVVLNTYKSDENGGFNIELGCEVATLKFKGEKEDYIEANKIIEVSPKSSDNIKLELNLKPVPKVAAIGTGLFKLLNLNPIYFDYDKSFIRSDAEIELAKIIKYMNEFPAVKVDVRSHTDSRGLDAYNFALSNRRNKSTIDYIIGVGGISADRLSGKGLGETQLTNNCSNGIKCSKEAHQANRRSEFIVIAN